MELVCRLALNERVDCYGDAITSAITFALGSLEEDPRVVHEIISPHDHTNDEQY